MASEKHLITVFSARGPEGANVVRTLAASGKYRVRAVSLEPDNSLRGVENLKADITKKADVDKAVKGAYAVFATTDVFDVGTEYYHVGKMVAEASKAAGVTHFLWSTLPNVEKISKGKWKVPFFTDRAKVDDVVRNLHFRYITFIETGFYYTNFDVGFTRPDYNNGSLIFDLPIGPDNVIAGCDPEDVGPVVLTALQHPTEWNTKYITLAGYNAPLKKWLEVFHSVTKRLGVLHRVDYNKPSDSMPQDVLQMFGWIREFGYFGGRDLSTGKVADPHLKSWEEWLRKSGWKGAPAGGA